MDVTGRVSGYRGVAVRCPGCAEPMTVETLSGASAAGPRVKGDEAEVDVCASCGGMWVDWFDGEVRMIAAEVLAGDAARASRASGAPASSTLRNEAYATGACPRCTRQLVVERYVLEQDATAVSKRTAAERPSLAQPTAADLLRCEECAGVFVSRASAELLATLAHGEEPPPSSTSPPETELAPLPWQRFMGLVRRIAGLE